MCYCDGFLVEIVVSLVSRDMVPMDGVFNGKARGRSIIAPHASPCIVTHIDGWNPRMRITWRMIYMKIVLITRHGAERTGDGSDLMLLQRGTAVF